APDLGASTKVVTDINGGQVEPGDVLRYTITVDNQGTANATNVQVTDVVGTSLTKIVPLDGGAFEQTTRRLTWSLATVGAKSSRQVRFDATVVLPLDDGTLISNQARIVAQGLGVVMTDDPSTPADDDPTVVKVYALPRFSTSTKSIKDENGGKVEPGDRLLYTLIVQNDGKSVADHVVLTDVLDGNLNFLSATGGGVFDAASRTIRWDVTTTPALTRVGVGPAAAVTVSFVATVKMPLANGTQVCNQGKIQSDEVTTPVFTDNEATPAVGDPTCVTISSAPDLAGATKTVIDENGGQVRPGDRLTWTIIVTNTGNAAATQVVVSDVIDTKVEKIVPGQGGIFNATTRRVTWDATTTPGLSALASGTSVSLTFTSVVRKPQADGATIENQAEIRAANLAKAVLTDDPATPAIDDATRVQVHAEADLSTSTKTVTDDNGGDVEPGDTLRYTITLKNTGDAVARDVTVRDAIDVALESVVALDGGVYDAASRTIRWKVGKVSLTPAGDITLRFSGRVVAPLANGTVIANQGQIDVGGSGTFKTDDPSTAALGDPTRVTVVSKAKLSTMTKGVAGAQAGRKVAPKTLLTYTIRVPNTGSEAASNVLIRDVISKELEDVVVLDGGSFDVATRRMTWTVAEIKVGKAATLRFRARVRAEAQNGKAIDNQASAELAGEPGSLVLSDDPDTPAKDDATRVIVSAWPDISRFDKSVVDENGGDVEPGDTLRYSLTVRNEGTAYVLNAVVVDQIQTADLYDVSASSGGKFNAGRIVWSSSTTPALAKIAPGATVTLSYTVKVRNPTLNGRIIRNQAILGAEGLTDEPSDDPSTPANNDSTDVRVVSMPDLSTSTKVAVDLNGGSLRPGDFIEYRLRVINSGSSQATGARVIDPIPTYTTYVPGSTRMNGRAVVDAPGRQSPLSSGVAVASPGASPGTIEVGAAKAGDLRFRVRVRDDVQEGTIVSNQGLLSTKEAPLFMTDDPSTAPKGDATQVVVGHGPNLNVTTKVYSPKPVGDDGDGRFDVGEEIAYTVVIRNTGSKEATLVVFHDPIDGAHGTYVRGTLGLNGKQLTDAGDGDAGSVAQNQIRVIVGTLDAGSEATITYRVRIVGGAWVKNQGTVRCRELPSVKTDDDGVDTNGDGPTMVPVGRPDRRVEVVKTVLDSNGGNVQAGDELLYTLTLKNGGEVDERVDVVDNLPAKTRFVPQGLNA
ncbi:MAG: DUF11 domain-containing protein, partial [Deltaproteobacteria bacterium]|nr:DUF11 domain-containing protein [Deltaproteobacteria bacterium]